MKLKISWNENLDMLKFKNLGKEREKIIEQAYIDAIYPNSKTNELGTVFHPKAIEVEIEDIKDETMNAKTFSLKPTSQKELPPFKAGQYIVLEVNIKDHVYKRAYTISSSPKNLKKYEITVEKVRNGLVSSYLVDEIKEHAKVIIHGPFGEFTYQPLRDQSDILALVGGSGITPIMSLARAIVDEKEECNLTIIYGEKSERDLLFKKELDELAKKSEKINVQYVLSDEQNSVYDTGFISKELIQKYEIGKYSYFVCGPIHFYHHLNEIFKELDIPNKYIRHDIFKEVECNLHHVEHSLTVITEGKEIKISCYEDESLMTALEKASIKAPSKCLVGVCGFCRSKLIEGKIKTTKDSVREKDEEYNYIHPCISYPLTDVKIKLCK